MVGLQSTVEVIDAQEHTFGHCALTAPRREPSNAITARACMARSCCTVELALNLLIVVLLLGGGAR